MLSEASCIRRSCRCCPARGAACRRRTAGRSPGRPRRSAGRAPTGRPGDSPGRVRGEVRLAIPPDRSTRTWQATISPPSASTAGIIARSEPPVVRMSSTRTTRSPGAIVKPRRNSRRVAPSASRTSSAKIARRPELAAGLEGQDHPAGRRPGDQVGGSADRRGHARQRPRSRTARSSRPCPGGPGTSPGTARRGGRS